MRIEGFALGNSPREYTPETVGGKTVVFTTTNGTRAMLHARAGRRSLAGGVRQSFGSRRGLPQVASGWT